MQAAHSNSVRVDVVLLAVAAAGTEVLVDIHTTAVGYSRISRWHCAVAAAVAAELSTRGGRVLLYAGLGYGTIYGFLTQNTVYAIYGVIWAVYTVYPLRVLCACVPQLPAQEYSTDYRPS